MPRHFSTPFIFIYVFISLKKFFQNKNSKGIVSGVDKFDNFFCHLLHLKGIEYDTIDAGHILVIMPENVKLLILECRGLPVKMLQDIVHHHGGILGPAHPCGERHLSITRTRLYKKHPEIMENFDFLEGFNSCESPESNAAAVRLAATHNLPMLGGSDSHHTDCVGTAYTMVPDTIACESDFIDCIKAKHPISYGGYYYHVLVESFWFYNRFASLYRHHRRKLAMASLEQ